MKLSKILIPTLSVAAVATPVCLTACSTVKEDNSHMNWDESASTDKKEFEIDEDLVDYADYTFTITDEKIKASDLKVTVEIASSNSYMKLFKVTSEARDDEQSIDVMVHINCDESLFKQKDEQVLKYNIKLQYKQEWYHLEKDFTFKYPKQA